MFLIFTICHVDWKVNLHNWLYIFSKFTSSYSYFTLTQVWNLTFSVKLTSKLSNLRFSIISATYSPSFFHNVKSTKTFSSSFEIEICQNQSIIFRSQNHSTISLTWFKVYATVSTYDLSLTLSSNEIVAILYSTSFGKFWFYFLYSSQTSISKVTQIPLLSFDEGDRSKVNLLSLFKDWLLSLIHYSSFMPFLSESDK